MNSLIIIALSVIAIALCCITIKLLQLQKNIRNIYELPHGESLYSINHHEFNSICLQYVLIAVRAIMYNWMRQSITSENYEAAKNWKEAITEIEKLIKTKINK